jgi:hypothetical protein
MLGCCNDLVSGCLGREVPRCHGASLRHVSIASSRAGRGHALVVSDPQPGRAVSARADLRFKDKAFFTDAERTDLDRQIAGILSRDSTEARRERGTERDVAGEGNLAIFTTHLRVGKQTSLVVDPPGGRIPPLTPEA